MINRSRSKDGTRSTGNRRTGSRGFTVNYRDKQSRHVDDNFLNPMSLAKQSQSKMNGKSTSKNKKVNTSLVDMFQYYENMTQAHSKKSRKPSVMLQSQMEDQSSIHSEEFEEEFEEEFKFIGDIVKKRH